MKESFIKLLEYLDTECTLIDINYFSFLIMRIWNALKSVFLLFFLLFLDIRFSAFSDLWVLTKELKQEMISSDMLANKDD